MITSQKGDTRVTTDTNGKVVTDERYVGKDSRNNFVEFLPFTWDLHRSVTLRDAYLDYPRNSWSYLRNLDFSQGKEVWYLLVKQNYFLGFDKLSRRTVGICDADGFKPANAAPHPFAQRLRDSIIFFRKPHLLWAGTALYSIDFSERSMTSFAAPNDVIWGALNVSGSYQDDKPAHTAVALDKAIRIFDAQGKSSFDVPYPHDPNLWSYLSLATNEANDRFYLISSPSAAPYWRLANEPATEKPIYLDEIDAQGHILRTYSRPNDSPPLPPPTWVGRLTTCMSALLPAAVGTIYYHQCPPLEITTFEDAGSISFPRPSLQVSMAEMAVLILVGLALAVVTAVWARRTGFSPRQASLWGLFVFCFGVAGLITFRLAADWPATVRCPQCRRMRSLHSEKCPHCHQPWAAPASSGTEIFDFEQAGI